MDKNINDVMIEAYDKLAKYSNELEDRIDKSKKELEELSNLYDDNYTISDRIKDILEILKGE